MIIELICSPLWAIINIIIDVIPTNWLSIGDTPSELFSLLYTAFQFFPSDVWVIALGCFVFWGIINFTTGLLLFILKCLPINNI